MPHVIALFFEKQGEHGVLGGEGAPEVCSLTEAEEVLAGQDCITRGRTGRTGDEGLLEEHSLPGDAIEGGSPDHRIPIGACVGPAPVVSDGEQDVRSIRCGLLCGGLCDEEQGEEKARHIRILAES